jgi:hypothetical protein
VLVVTGLRVGVAIDGLQCPLGVLKLHLCVFLLLGVHLLLALSVPGRHASWRCCCIFSQNCSMSFLISRHSDAVWQMELCTGHFVLPSPLLDS